MKTELATLMRAAWEAGFSVVPAGPGKRPTIEWKQYIEKRCELDQLLIWLAEDHEAYAILGGGPERLVFFDFEAGFDLHAFAELLRDADLYDLFEGWMQDYWVRTPSEGMHVAVRLDGSGPVPGNTKLAFDAAGKTTAELRGDRGLVIGPGSNGHTHPNGGQWILARGGFETIPYVPHEQFEQVCVVIATMNEAPLAPVDRGTQPAAAANPSAGGVSLAQIERGSSYLDEARAAMPTMREVLERYGWQFHHADADYVYMTRPGKDLREGHSGTINAADRLFVFSSNAHPIPPSVGRQTFSVIDVLALYEGVDGGEIVRQYKPSSPGREAPSQPPSDLVLPEEFWHERPLFEHILTAARARRVSPDAVLGMLLSYYAATLPWNFRLPQDGTLDLITVLVGDAGAGKTSAKRAALALLPEEAFELPEIHLMLPSPSTGEGMMEAYILREKGLQVGLRYRGCAFYTDEGGAFFEVAGRKGNQVVETLKSAWVGEMTGTVTATQDRHRILPSQGVRMAAMVGIQVDPASQFLNEDKIHGGLPQRCLWFWAHRERSASWNQPGVETPEWPGRLDLPLYPHHNWGGGSEPTITHDLEVCSEVWGIISAERDRQSFDEGTSALDAHRAHSTEKVAMILALADRRRTLELSDWNLASQIWQTGREIRTQIAARKKEAFGSKFVALGQADAVRAEAARLHRVDLAAAALGRRVWRSDGPVIYDQAKNSVRQYDAGPFSMIRDRAVDLGYVVFHKGEGLSAGGTRPPRGRG